MLVTNPRRAAGTLNVTRSGNQNYSECVAQDPWRCGFDRKHLKSLISRCPFGALRTIY